MAKRGVYGENKMKVSVITVCYNAILGIEKTIKSVVGQTYPEVEYIVIDGGSTDGTIDIIKKYTDKIACFVSEPDDGIYDAMNKGIRIATGEWINFMNAGDTFSSDTIISTVFSERYKEEVEVIYGDVYFTESHDCNYLQPARPLCFLRRAMPFCHQSSFVKRKAITGFDKQFQICADYSFFYSLYHDKPNSFCYKSVPISVYDNRHGLSMDNPRKHRKENLEIRSKHKDVRWLVDLVKYHVKFSVLKMKK